MTPYILTKLQCTRWREMVNRDQVFHPTDFDEFMRWCSLIEKGYAVLTRRNPDGTITILRGEKGKP